jgi:hypothetical protein
MDWGRGDLSGFRDSDLGHCPPIRRELACKRMMKGPIRTTFRVKTANFPKNGLHLNDFSRILHCHFVCSSNVFIHIPGSVVEKRTLLFRTGIESDILLI